MSVNATTFNAMSRAFEDVQSDLLRRAGEKYGFDAAQAITDLVDTEVKIVPDQAAPKKAAPKKAKKVVDKSDEEADERKAEKPPKFVPPALALPWTGVVVVGCCEAIRGNYNTFTQCTNVPRKNSSFCTTCSKADAPKCGTTANRNESDWRDPDKGKRPVHYSTYIKSKKLEPQDVIDEAAKFGINITLSDLAPPSKPTKSSALAKDSDDDEPNLPLKSPDLTLNTDEADHQVFNLSP